MKNRLNKYRDNLDFPEWMAEFEEQLAQLYASYVAETGSAQEFQSFCIGMYLETTHAMNLIERNYN